MTYFRRIIDIEEYFINSYFAEPHWNTSSLSWQYTILNLILCREETGKPTVNDCCEMTIYFLVVDIVTIYFMRGVII